MNRRSLLGSISAVVAGVFAGPIAGSTVALADSRDPAVILIEARKLLEARCDKVWTAADFHVEAYPRQWAFSRCPTGELFISFAGGGWKPEGEPPLFMSSDAGSVVRSWQKHVMEYAAGKRGTLYWREGPTLNMETVCDGDKPKTLYSVYSRFVISDKPLAKEFKMSADELSSLTPTTSSIQTRYDMPQPVWPNMNLSRPA